jgi:hypothetical protein
LISLPFERLGDIASNIAQRDRGDQKHIVRRVDT